MFCLHPTCDTSAPHKHFFQAEKCKEGRHRSCKGYVINILPTVLSEEDIIKKQKRECEEHLASGGNDFFQLNELHRREWERFVESRGRSTIIRKPKVWCCSCECHDEVRRTVLVVGSVDLRRDRMPRPWSLHQ